MGCFVQHVGIQIGSVRPHECPRLGVYDDSLEEGAVPQCAKDPAATSDPWADIGDTLGPVRERQGDAEGPDDPHLRDAWKHALDQGGDRRQRLVSVQSLPDLEQLSWVKAGLLEDEGQGARSQSVAQEADGADANLRFGSSVSRVEIGRLVIQEVHPDHDAEDATDLRPCPEVRAD